ncbi:photosystem I reaction center subunit IX [Nostoc sp.]|uniref:photosystem I reaction center subunit IX n=1 Tax=Nostoc sp. TaxID=1180 RepID=UPI002FFAEB60
MESRYFLKLFTMVPVVATLALIILAVIFIELNYVFPGLQYGTFFHPLPSSMPDISVFKILTK